MFKAMTISAAIAMTAAACALPVEVEWRRGAPAPVAVARPFAGFLPSGEFLFAGGSAFRDDEKTWLDGVWALGSEGWKARGALPRPLADGVSCTLPAGVFCAGGTDGREESRAAWIFGPGLEIRPMPDLPETVVMGAAVAEGENLYVVTRGRIYHLAPKASEWRHAGTCPGPERLQFAAAVQTCDQKARCLIVYGGYDAATCEPLDDGWAWNLESGAWRQLAPLPPGTTTIGATLVPTGCQHLLLVGGFGRDGWRRRALEGSTETDPRKLGWSGRLWAFNAVTGAWCEYGALDAGDVPRCGAAVAAVPGTDGSQLLVAGGEIAPRVRTAEVFSAKFVKTARFGAKAWIVVGLYALLMAGMAFYFIRKKKSADDYFRGGRRIPWYVAGMSIFATMLSSITFIAIPTQTYMSDWRYFPMAICIFLIAPIAIRYYLPFFCRLGITSAYEYLERRFNLGVRLFGSAAFVVFMVCRVAVVTLLPAIALNAVTGMSIDAAILVCGALTIVYCSLGGLEAVIWSDFVQGVVLVGGAVAVLVILVAKTGAPGEHIATFWREATAGGKTTLWDFRMALGEPVFWVVLVQGLVSNLSSYTSDQCVIQRYIATPDEASTRRSIWFNGVMSVFASVVFYGIGTALWTHYRTMPAAMDATLPKVDSVFPAFMAAELPWYLAGLVIAAIFAATISTLSANLSSASTAVVTDFIRRFRPQISNRTQIRCGQCCTAIVGVLGVAAALVLSRIESRALFDSFQEFIAMLTAGLTGVFFMGVFMESVKGRAAVVGLLANYVVCLALKLNGYCCWGVRLHPFLAGGIGLVVCIAVAWLTALVLPERGKNLKGLTLRTVLK